jgi:transposase
MKKVVVSTPQKKREFTKEFKQEAVQMTLDGLTAAVVAERLGIGNPQLVQRWKRQLLKASGPAAESLEARVRHLEEALRQTERERDVLKKALSIFSRGT